MTTYMCWAQGDISYHITAKRKIKRAQQDKHSFTKWTGMRLKAESSSYSVRKKEYAGGGKSWFSQQNPTKSLYTVSTYNFHKTLKVCMPIVPKRGRWRQEYF